MVEALQGVISLSSKMSCAELLLWRNKSLNVLKIRCVFGLYMLFGGYSVWIGLCQQSKVNPFTNLSITVIAVVWSDIVFYKIMLVFYLRNKFCSSFSLRNYFQGDLKVTIVAWCKNIQTSITIFIVNLIKSLEDLSLARLQFWLSLPMQ